MSVIYDGPNERRCWDCGNVAVHLDFITPHVLCKKCGSQDTRRLKEQSCCVRRDVYDLCEFAADPYNVGCEPKIDCLAAK